MVLHKHNPIGGNVNMVFQFLHNKEIVDYMNH